MEEDDEIQSPGSESPQSPASLNCRITGTMATPVPTPSSQTMSSGQNTLALPFQQLPSSNAGGREDCWSEGATSVLIDAWGERYLGSSKGNLNQKHGEEVAAIVSSREDYKKTQKTPKTDNQCKNRIDTIKKKFKSEKAKLAAGAGPSKWPFFERLDHLIGTSAKIIGSVGNVNLLQTQKVPFGIPIGIGSLNHQYQHKRQHQPFKNQTISSRRWVPDDSDSSDDVPSSESADSFPPDTFETKRRKVMQRGEMNENAGGGGRGGVVKEGGEGKEWLGGVKELTQAILKFGEVYEQAESSKLQQVVEMEKQRMNFAKELELQRMQIFRETQLEISQSKHGRSWKYQQPSSQQ